jgi:hypothetical protein
MDDFFVPEADNEIEICATQQLETAPVPLPHAVAAHLPANPLAADLTSTRPELYSTLQACLLAAKAPGTVAAYAGALRRFEDFCINNSFPYPDFSHEALLQYILHLVRVPASFAAFAALKPAITYLDTTMGRPSSFTPFLDLVLTGAKRNARAAAGPVKKAPVISIEDLQRILDMLYVPFKSHIAEINPLYFRTIFRLMIEYHTLCRLNCFRQLRACHFELIRGDILITFPHAKNDQLHQGQSSFLVASDSEYCPVRLTKLYFRKFGLHFGMEAGDNTFVNFQLRRHAAVTAVIPHRSLSTTGATEHLRKLLAAVGLPNTAVTDKSVKMAGVTAAYEAGASSEDVMHIGRWRTVSIPLRYKFNSYAFKKSVASKVPALDGPTDALPPPSPPPTT